MGCWWFGVVFVVGGVGGRGGWGMCDGGFVWLGWWEVEGFGGWCCWWFWLVFCVGGVWEVVRGGLLVVFGCVLFGVVGVRGVGDGGFGGGFRVGGGGRLRGVGMVVLVFWLCFVWGWWEVEGGRGMVGWWFWWVFLFWGWWEVEGLGVVVLVVLWLGFVCGVVGGRGLGMW